VTRSIRDAWSPAGAKTALRDAMLLIRALSFVGANRLGLRSAVAAYETEMIRFSPARVAGLCCPWDDRQQGRQSLGRGLSAALSGPFAQPGTMG
jgi:hypothetical protein